MTTNGRPVPPHGTQVPPNGTLPVTYRQTRRAVVLLAGIAAGAVLAGCNGGTTGISGTPAPPPESATFEVTGTITVSGSHAAKLYTDKSCDGDGGYGDIREGTEVRVTVDGKTVARSDLEPGVTISDTAIGQECRFEFNVSEVPAGAKFYAVEVSHRGESTYTESELRASGLELSLGH